MTPVPFLEMKGYPSMHGVFTPIFWRVNHRYDARVTKLLKKRVTDLATEINVLMVGGVFGTFAKDARSKASGALKSTGAGPAGTGLCGS
jgi:hypothetical protein